MRPSFGANLMQTVTHIWQKAFFKYVLAHRIHHLSEYLRQIQVASLPGTSLLAHLTCIGHPKAFVGIFLRVPYSDC